ncbi:hypothetical protein [Streptomyces sp. NBC_01092]|uniref:hypothetical protein n=1 Tax=Streptomyces sp. NBC_01092 TaxID=2903748 RepID=UPI0038673BAF|nr:hypothetical protein OG254_12440 [Streptomyces sp. NBC_01092]WSU51250.1 hypothetical protein OG254_24230 [Streptomyces sp. NBC_01092]
MTVVARMILPRLDMAAGVVACPECAQDDALVVTVDVEDTSETPAFMRCDAGHQWADQQVTRGFAVEVFELMKREFPDLIRLSAMD